MFKRLKTKNPRKSVFKDRKQPNVFSKSPGTTSSVTKANEASRLVRCKHCGFICDKERDVRLKDGSYGRKGISHGTQQDASATVGDAMTPETSLTDHIVHFACEDNAADTTISAVSGIYNGVSQLSNTEDMSTTSAAVGSRAFQFADGGGEGGDWAGISDGENNLSLKTYDNFSISCWIKASATDFAHHILHEGETATTGGWSTGGASEMHLSLGYVQPTDLAELDNYLVFYIGDTATDVSGQISIGYAFSDTTGWNHVAVSVSNLSSNPYARMWINGVHRDRDWGTVTSITRSVWDSGLTIGKDFSDSAYYYGGLDDLRIFSKSINTLEVLAIYNSGAGTSRYGASVTSVDQYYATSVNGGCPNCASYVYDPRQPQTQVPID